MADKALLIIEKPKSCLGCPLKELMPAAWRCCVSRKLLTQDDFKTLPESCPLIPFEIPDEEETERLTDRFSDGTAFVPEHVKQRYGMQSVHDRLAHFEDMENRLKTAYGEKKKFQYNGPLY